MSKATHNIFLSSFTLWILGAIACLYYLSPLVMPNSQIRPLKFGIDLVGGTYISLLVDTDKAVEDSLYEKISTIKSDLKQAKLELPTKTAVEKSGIVLTFENYDAANQASDKLRNADLGLKLSQSDKTIRGTLTTQEEKKIRHWAVESNIRVLENRLNRFAVSEVTVAQQGEKNIIVELPNVDDPAKAKAMIGKAAILEFRLVLDEGMTPEDVLDKHDNELPEGTEILPEKVRFGHESSKVYFLVQKHTDITGRLLRDAAPAFGDKGEVVVRFQFNAEGGKKFYELTSKNMHKRLAIVLDNEIISAPEIQAAIKDSGHISSTTFTMDSAKELADLLKSGAYVAPVKFDEERTVGPSLGAQAIRQGTIACLLGLFLLLLFSILYYKLPGIFAFVTLVYNLILILVALGYFGGTLTLPGIASLILTLGMAIDSSILIYEKIKEELRHGVTLQKAIDSGFSGALVVILDANITTFIMGVVLYYFGTGPVQGFAITLMIGILTTLITGLFFLRSLFTLATKGLGVHSMKF